MFIINYHVWSKKLIFKLNWNWERMILSKIDTYNISIIEHSPVQVNNRLKRRQEDVNESSNWSIFYYSLTKSFTGKYFVRRRSVLQPRSCCNTPKGKYHLMVSLSKLKDGYTPKMWKCANTPSTRTFVWGFKYVGHSWAPCGSLITHFISLVPSSAELERVFS